MTTAALIVAAGRGTRASANGPTPKQYVDVGGRPLLAHTLDAFIDHSGVDVVVVVIHADDRGVYEDAVAASRVGANDPLLPPAFGGATRQASVLAGLTALEHVQPSRVLIHDAARPFVSADVIDRVLEGLATCDGAIAAVPLSDTLKAADAHGRIAGTIARAGLWRAQTPQGFAFPAILAAHRRAATEAGSAFTDDAAIAEWAGLPVTLVVGSGANEKITTPEDIAMARLRLSGSPAALEPRSGTGFDVHRFTAGDHVWLCGVRIAHDQRLEGHSDADVGLHALTDALLGAIGDGDIGQHFPPSDMRWKGADSAVFLADARERVLGRGGRIVNVDVTLLCEAPRIGPHRDAMRARLAELLGIDVTRVGVKATTTEGLGFTGRREGIAAMASAMVLVPSG
ncbi:MAG: bifunctional 2-C-methyl-D-erythritol 4-phosphate cytidylyltransferase/2-C-methyl-D-erythritol 2,4-cyclodiphosphate synthase [Hyphomicrobiaceae bacterium]|nr:bifunctional 2-C-methyl-D-erythritol 4-phosphate cytidylyltransferase/2-C-methyl-D-erythritol 2,4-cyclodiphosphate synthase [Hyphomicrobiaceae bacterium]